MKTKKTGLVQSVFVTVERAEQQNVIKGYLKNAVPFFNMFPGE